jgi:UDP-N-acetylglucosamine--N-acetylmuramyl-(pentapeptide) pyrophosphoryl-undecaprenol N-acetylglucosamine transferase
MDKYIVFGTGKTGGHLFPAIVIGNSFRKYNYEAKFFIDGKKYEITSLKKYNFSHKKIFSAPFPEKSIISIFNFIFLNSVGIIQCCVELFKRKPRCAVITGGYTSFPLGIASILLFVPLFTYEGNIYIGKSNRILSFLSRMNFGPKKSGFGRFMVAGNPVREEMKNESFSFIDNKKEILVTGGSQGSKIILDTLLKMFKKYDEFIRKANFHFTIATGYKNIDLINKFNNYSYVNAIDFIFDMKKFLKKSNLLICRAGAMTIEENLAMGRFGIYIPFKRSAGNHQLHNAKWIKKMAVGEPITENDLNKDVLFRSINDAYNDINRLKALSQKARMEYEKRHTVSIEKEIMRRI